MVTSLFLPSLCISRELGAYERLNDLADPSTQKVWGQPLGGPTSLASGCSSPGTLPLLSSPWLPPEPLVRGILRLFRGWGHCFVSMYLLFFPMAALSPTP